VEHVIADDQLKTSAAKEKEWFAEELQTDVGVERVRQWAKENRALNDDDIFISTNVDEVLSREALHKLRWCQPTRPVLSGALWMPIGRFDLALRTDRPAAGRPHTWALPTIYRWADIASGHQLGRRLFGPPHTGKEENYVLGGTHLTKPAFLPSAILKELSATEKGWYPGLVNMGFLLKATKEDLDREQAALYNLDDNRCWQGFSDPMSKVTDVEAYIPWYLECNPDSFPYWFGKPDPRNAALVTAMATIGEEFKRSHQSFFSSNQPNKLFPISFLPTNSSSDTRAAQSRCLAYDSGGSYTQT